MIKKVINLKSIWNSRKAFATGVFLFLSILTNTSLIINAQSAPVYEVQITLWPGGNIPYKFDFTDQGRRDLVKEAMHKWEVSGAVHFTDCSTSCPEDFLLITTAGNSTISSNSSMGVIKPTADSNGQETLQIKNWDSTEIEYVLAHELGHAIGLIHEHQRPDSNNYIKVNEEYIDKNYLSEYIPYRLIQYNVPSTNTYTNFYNSRPYDYYSIMHYDQRDGSAASDNLTTFTILKDGIDASRVGKTDVPTNEDISRVKFLYTSIPNISSPCEVFNDSNTVVLYDEKNCEGAWKYTTSIPLPWHNLASFNNQPSSVRVLPGWSVRVFYDITGLNTTSLPPEKTTRCFTRSMWDLSQDYYGDKGDSPLNINNTISSIQVFYDSTCGGSYLNDLMSCGGSGAPCSPSTPPTGSCPSGQNGNYCGGTSISGGTAGKLYNCTNGVWTEKYTCSNGCIQMPQGQDDYCATSTADYCKQITWGGAGNYCKGNNLVTCSSIKTTTNEVTCAFGCQINPLFQSDVCKTSSDGTIVSSETAKFFGDSDYGETSLRLSLGLGKSDQPSKNTLYKSVKLPDGWSIKVFSEDAQQGDQACWSTSKPLVETLGWHNKIESVEISTTNICPSTTPEPPYWTAHYYDGDSKWWDRDIPSNTARCHEKITGEKLVDDLGADSPCGGGSSGDNWVGEYTATRNFPEGDYVFNIKSDDGVQLFIDGKQRAIRSSQGDGPICPEFHLSGDVNLRFILREDSGDALIDADWSTDISACKDVTPPTGSMTEPEKNTYKNSTSPILLSATGYDISETGQNVTNISKIEFYAKSNAWNNNEFTLVATDTTSPYEQNLDTSTMPEGIYFLTAKVYDGEGNDSGFLGDENFWTYITVDRTVPTAELKPIVLNTGFSFNVEWSGHDNSTVSTELNFDVEYQTNCTGDWNLWVGFRSGTSKTFLGIPSETYCFRARTIDLANNVGAWSATSNSVTLPSCGENMFTAEYYNGTNLSGSPIQIQCENSINHNWGDGGHGFDISEGTFGDGGDGDLNITSNIVDSPVDATANGFAGSIILNASNSNFRAGHKILIYQVKGNNSGTYQINSIKSYNTITGVITTSEPLNSNYVTSSNNAAQVIVIKQYANVYVAPNVTWKAKEWNGQTGGLLVYMANGNTNIEGIIDATGSGFRGGRSGANPNPFADNTAGEQGENASGSQQRTTSRALNGAGGGVNRDFNGEGNGAGGGGNGSDGQEGGRHISTSGAVGQGGAAIGDPSLSKIYFGGAGGGGGFGDAETTAITVFGNGGDGGGIVFINSKDLSISASGAIVSTGVTGQAGSHDIGAGGNGAGGSVLIKGKNVNVNSQRINTTANNTTPGGTSGGGGRGGEGRVRIEYFETQSGQSIPAASIAKVVGGVDNFSVRWSGIFSISPNRYRFNTYSDDGIRLWVDGNMIIDDWSLGYRERSVSSFINNPVEIKVEYFEKDGNAQAKLNIVPDSNLKPIISEVPVQVTSIQKEFTDLDLNLYGYDPEFNYIYWEVNDSTNVHVTIDEFNIAHITKTAGWSGEESLTFRLYDEWEEWTERTVIFKVINNTPPEFSLIPDQTTNEDVSFTEIDLNNYATDVDPNTTLVFSVSGESNLTPIIDENGKLNVTPKPDWNGEETLNLTVTDELGESDTTTIRFIVLPVNDSPVISSSPLLNGLEDSQYIYQVSASDIDSNLVYSILSGPVGLTIDQSGKISWLPLQSDVGTHLVKLQVTDGEFNVAQEYNLTILNVNDAPVITSSPVTEVVDGSPYSYDVQATDEDGDTLTYSLASAPAGMSINSTTGVISWNPGQSNIGDRSISVVVSDGTVSTLQNFNLKVIAKYTFGSYLITRERKGIENKKVNIGETVNFAMYLDNNTNQTAGHLQITLETTNPHVKITDKNEMMLNAKADSSSLTSGEFIFEVSKDAVVGEVIHFVLQVKNLETKEVYTIEFDMVVE
jgi:hypothetical protein